MIDSLNSLVKALGGQTVLSRATVLILTGWPPHMLNDLFTGEAVKYTPITKSLGEKKSRTPLDFTGKKR